MKQVKRWAGRGGVMVASWGGEVDVVVSWGRTRRRKRMKKRSESRMRRRLAGLLADWLTGWLGWAGWLRRGRGEKNYGLYLRQVDVFQNK